VIFETTRDEENVSRLYKTSTEHLELATALPLQQGYVGSISSDGARIAYNPRLAPATGVIIAADLRPAMDREFKNRSTRESFDRSVQRQGSDLER
jgi:hypothetical protein